MAHNATQKAGGAFRGALPDMDYFDKLPPSARHALANAVFDWSAGAVFNNWRKAKPGWKTGPAAAAKIAEWDRNQIKRDRKRRKD